MKLKIIKTTLLILILSGCSKSNTPFVSVSWPCMGTYFTLTLPSSEKSKMTMYQKICQQCLENLESKLSIFSTSSEISLLNARAGEETPWVKISPETITVITSALFFARLSEGSFEPTILPLMKLWGFYSSNSITSLPAKEEIENTLKLTGYENISISNDMACITKKGCMIDLGGIAKGFAVDLCYESLCKAGATDFLIDLGGNIRVANLLYKTTWKIGIRNPYRKDPPIVGTIFLTNGMAVATSGNYERYITINNTRYTHIISPHTGYPVDYISSVTVIADNACTADALSTACFVSGVERSFLLANKLPHIGILICPLPENYTLFANSYMANFLKLSVSNYHLKIYK